MICLVKKHIPSEKQPSKVRYVAVPEQFGGQRVDNYLLRELKGVPKTRIYRLLRKGEVRVNGKRVGPAVRLGVGDEVRLPPVRIADPARHGEIPEGVLRVIEQSVLYEDPDMLVLDKPSGLAVHGGSGLRFGVIEALRASRPQEPFLDLVHRLDRETSGCLVIARKRSVLRALHELLRRGGMEKDYLVLLSGDLPPGRFVVDAPLDRHARAGGERTVRVAEGGKAAYTEFEVLERYGPACLARARIGTGRTHQIRVHAAHVGHPVLGDARYGDKAANRNARAVGLKRLALHAQSLRFTMPGGGREHHFTAPLSNDLRAVVDALEKGPMSAVGPSNKERQT